MTEEAEKGSNVLALFGYMLISERETNDAALIAAAERKPLDAPARQKQRHYWAATGNSQCRPEVSAQHLQDLILVEMHQTEEFLTRG